LLHRYQTKSKRPLCKREDPATQSPFCGRREEVPKPIGSGAGMDPCLGRVLCQVINSDNTRGWVSMQTLMIETLLKDVKRHNRHRSSRAG